MVGVLVEGAVRIRVGLISKLLLAEPSSDTKDGISASKSLEDSELAAAANPTNTRGINGESSPSQEGIVNKKTLEQTDLFENTTRTTRGDSTRARARASACLNDRLFESQRLLHEWASLTHGE